MALNTSTPLPPVLASGRLPSGPRPLLYALTLTLDPSQSGFSGESNIELSVAAATPYVVLHGQDLEVDELWFEQDGERIAATIAVRAAASQTPDEWVIHAARALRPSADAHKTQLRIRYHGTFSNDLSAMYRVLEPSGAYVFTQFEATDARRAFPCFDEPAFKVPYQVSLRVPATHHAYSNGAQLREELQGAWKTVHFAETRPLPAFLVAFATGPLQVAASAQGTPAVRILTANGRSGAEPALAGATALTQILANYTGIAYPYGKLDLVAVPQFSAGAMENAGLITFREERLLLPGAAPSARSMRSLELIEAHELAHQWTGNLVTPEFWDELWLSEGFASFLEAKAVDTLHSDHAAQTLAALATLGAMESETLAATRVVRQPATTTADAFDAFDDITYTKGAALLRMLESYMGSAAFQRGINAYLTKYAHANATTENLTRTLDAVAAADGIGKANSSDWRSLPPSELINSYLRSRGVPVIKIGVTCKAGTTSSLLGNTALEQKGSSAGLAQQHSVPICHSIDGHETCSLLAEGQGMLMGTHSVLPPPNPHAHRKPAAPTCPTRVQLTSRAEPYAWISLDSPNNLVSLDYALAGPVLGPRIVMSAAALFRARTSDAPYLHKILDATLASREPAVGIAAVAALRSLAPSIRKDAGVQRYISNLFIRKLAALTLEQRPSDTAIDIELRRALALGLVDFATGSEWIVRARTILKRWLSDRSSVAADDAYLAMELVARADSAADFDAMWSAYLAPGTPQDKVALLKALGAFGTPELVAKLYAHVLDKSVTLQDIRYLTRSAVLRGSARGAVLRWIADHLDAVKGVMPNSSIWHMATLLEATCDDPALAAAGEKLRAAVTAVEGGARAAAQAMQRAERCKRDETRSDELKAEFAQRKNP
jgi:cytosol alanyl aminopeptidase